jgi:murein L,D-transpeptidase YafK
MQYVEFADRKHGGTRRVWRPRWLWLALWLPLFTASAKTGWPPPLAAPAQRADEIHVVKHERRMDLLRDGRVIRSYSIRLGDQPYGHKRQQGDERTPEGRYRISFRNDKSRFHLSLRVSYPNEADRAQARKRGVDPGGDIMIHGGTPPGYWRNWTDGCIALTNREIEEVWRLVPVGTPIVIEP